MTQSGLLGLDPICCEVGILDNQDARELLLGLGKDSKASILSMVEDEVHHRRLHDYLSMV